MKLLLDTHVLLWWLNDLHQLSESARNAIFDSENQVLVSAATIWEIAIKSNLGKLSAPPNLEQVIYKSEFHELAVTSQHALAIRDLPRHRRDPFDRLLIAQAIVENATIVTRDAVLQAYECEFIVA